MASKTEGINNMGWVCNECNALRKQKVQKAIAGYSLSSFIGQYVKIAFETGNDMADTEHMWVEIEGISDNGKLSGKLANEPQFCKSLSYGDPINVALEDIEDVFVEGRTI